MSSKPPKPNRNKRSYTTAIIAKAHNCTPDYVRKVMRGDRKNDAIKASYKLLMAQNKKLLKSLKAA